MNLSQIAPLDLISDNLGFEGKVSAALNTPDSSLWMLTSSRIIRFRPIQNEIFQDTLALGVCQASAITHFEGKASVLCADGTMFTGSNWEATPAPPLHPIILDRHSFSQRSHSGQWFILSGGEVWRQQGNEWKAIGDPPSTQPSRTSFSFSSGAPRLITGSSGLFALFSNTVMTINPALPDLLSPVAGFENLPLREFSERHQITAGIGNNFLRVVIKEFAQTLALPFDPIAVEVTHDSTVIVSYKRDGQTQLQRYRFEPDLSRPENIRATEPPITFEGQAMEGALWATQEGEILVGISGGGVAIAGIFSQGRFEIDSVSARPLQKIKRMQDGRILAAYQDGLIQIRKNQSWEIWKDYKKEWHAELPTIDPDFAKLMGQRFLVQDFSVTPDDRVTFLRRFEENDFTFCGRPNIKLIGNGPFPFDLTTWQLFSTTGLARFQGVTFRTGPYGLLGEGNYSSLKLVQRRPNQKKTNPSIQLISTSQKFNVSAERRTVDAIGRVPYLRPQRER
jgi:hypothetical protein